MFRLTLISLFLAAASARELEFVSTEHAMRQLQFGDINFDEIAFNFGGINFSANEARESCPPEFDAILQCLLKDCNNALEVCPDLTIPEENQGTTAPVVEAPTETTDEETTGATTDGATTDETMEETDAPMDEEIMDEETMEETAAPTEGMDDEDEDEVMETGSPTATPEETGPGGPGPEEAGPGPEDAVAGVPNATDTRWLQGVTTMPVPTCEEIEESFCEFLGGEDTEGCCLTECTDQIQALLVCYLKATTGEDRGDCGVPDCPTPVPAEKEATTAPAVDSGAATVTRVATLAASLLAFAVL